MKSNGWTDDGKGESLVLLGLASQPKLLSRQWSGDTRSSSTPAFPVGHQARGAGVLSVLSIASSEYSHQLQTTYLSIREVAVSIDFSLPF